MSLGTMISVAKGAAVGPVFNDQVTLVGANPYVSGGITGMLAKLRALRGDQRQIVSVVDQSVGPNYCIYTPADDKLHVFVRTTGVERSAADDSANTYAFEIESI